MTEPTNEPANTPVKDDAIARLQSLQTDFESVAADVRKPKFFRSWFEDAKQAENEYRIYATMTKMAKQLVEADQSVAARIPLDNLKKLFDKKAAACDKAAHSFFRSWNGQEEQDAARYKDYAQKVSAVQKLV